jgi:hypothetical protein
MHATWLPQAPVEKGEKGLEVSGEVAFALVDLAVLVVVFGVDVRVDGRMTLL